MRPRRSTAIAAESISAAIDVVAGDVEFSFEPSYIELAVDGLRKAGVPEKTTVAEKL